jgi:hypothetical protein
LFAVNMVLQLAADMECAHMKTSYPDR